MSSPVNRRPYRSPQRAEQLRRTRRTVVAAAAELFVRDGYAGTTIDAVAAAAGVSRRTVFNAVGGKVALLKLALDWAIVGDDEPVAMADRPEVARVLAITDPVEAVRFWVPRTVVITARVAPIGRVLAAAADADPEAAALLAESERQRHWGAGAFVDHLVAIGELRPGLTRDRAADLYWLHTDRTLYVRLVLERGWPVEEFRDWLVEAVLAALLP